MRIFLDENFPLGLERQLKHAGFQAEHVITIGWRGAPDARIRSRLVEGQTCCFSRKTTIFSSAKGRSPSSSSRA